MIEYGENKTEIYSKMKEKKMRRTGKMLLFVILLLIQGCSTEDQSHAENAAEIMTAFEWEKETVIEEEQTDGDLTIKLNHVAFVENCVVVDYTMKASDTSRYEDIMASVQIAGTSFDERNIYTVKEGKKELQQVCYINTEKGAISQENVGKTAEIVFESFYKGADSGSDISMIFPVEIKKVFVPRTVEVNQEFSCDAGTVTLESLEISKFYTDVHMDISGKENFMDDFYSWEIIDETGKEIQFLGGSEDVYRYTALPRDCKEVCVTVIKYKKDLSYEKISGTEEISVEN